MPVTQGTVSDAYILSFALPTGAFYSFEVSGLECVQHRLSHTDLERWWEIISLHLGSIREGNESYGEAIDRVWGEFLAARPRFPPSTYEFWSTPALPTSAPPPEDLEVALRRALHNFTPQRIIIEAPAMPTPPPPADLPNEGAPPTVEPSTYLGMPVVRTTNVRVNTVTIQAAGIVARRTIYIHPNTPLAVWQEEARRQLARTLQRSATVSIKRNCRYCGKAYPAHQGTTMPDPYCSARCREAAQDLSDCPACGGTGRNGTGEGKCGECFGSTYKPCDSCQEDHARTSLMFTNPSTGTVYYVCPSCVQDEREAGGVQAPQASV